MAINRDAGISPLIEDHQSLVEDIWNLRSSKSIRPCQREAGLVPVITQKFVKTKDEEKDYVQKRLDVLQEQSLIPIKEDLAEWISRLLDIDISADSFIDTLDNGTEVCKLANYIQRKAQQCVVDGSYTDPLPNVKLKFKENAASGSWLARDNVASFLSWCEAYRVPKDCMFETEDLVSHKYEKSVVNCILELARIGYIFGIEPPSLIKIEEEIKVEEEIDDGEEEEVEIPSCLDVEVRKIAFKCKCHEHVKRMGAEKYRAFGKVINVRFLHNRHVLVRVGGGWDTLEHYLERHKPVEIFQHKNQMDITYLYIKSHYVNDGSQNGSISRMS